MPHSIPALVTPEVMKWARLQAGLHDVNVAASRIGRPPEDITAWEAGTKAPSLAQARKAAEVYRRSLAVFYLPEPPQGFQTMRDYRQHAGSQNVSFSPELTFLIRTIENKQAWLAEWAKNEGASYIPHIGAASLDKPAAEVAKAIRIALGIKVADQIACITRREALNLWIEKAEAIGINVCRQGEIDCNEARGFVLTNVYAPFIFINSSDVIVAQLFTLAHELAHLWINAPGLSNLEGIGRGNDDDEAKIEVFCNSVAAYTLLEDSSLKELWAKASGAKDLGDRIARVSNVLKISEEVIARRLLEQNKISIKDYQSLREYFAERWRQYKRDEKAKMRSRKGGPSPHLLRVLLNGRIFTRTVLSSFFEGTLPGADASRLLSVKVNNFPKVAEHAGLIPGRRYPLRREP